jgi:hypothetical protein
MRSFPLAAIALSLLSCRTEPLSDPGPIPVPSGLSSSQVGTTILLELAGQPIPRSLPVGAEIADRVLEARLPGYESISRRRRGWYAESAESGLIHAGFTNRAHYMRVAIRFDETTVTLRLVESENLNQAKGRIHQNALRWIDQLAVRIRRALGEVAASRALGESTPH